MISTLPLIQAKAIHRQIGDHIRELIISGKLAPEAKLPTTEELAASWGSNPTTIQNALAPLVKEGLLIRVPKLGTFVRKREEKLTCVGVYGDCGTTDAQNSPYANSVRRALREELEKDGIEMDLWMDPRPRDQQGEPWKPLIKAAEERQFQAFIGAEINLDLIRWQRKLPVPVAFLGAPVPVANNVEPDPRQFVELGLRELARQGCRSVGFIAPLLDTPDAGNPEGFQLVLFDMLSHFMKVAGDLGLTVKNDWMRVLVHHSDVARGQEHFGYEQFLAIWSQPEKPEGLLVFTDITARGALMAIQEKQVRVPSELKLALAKNESIDLFCPVSATFVVASEREMARALIGQVQKQFRGESCERVSLPFKLVAHINP